jgi:outer membrane protein
MKRIQYYFVCLFILSVITVPCRAFALGLEAGVGYWKQNPSGTLEYNPAGTATAADSLDLKNDMNLGSKSRPFVRVKAELPLFLPNVYFMATPMSFEGTGTKNVNFTYGNQTFNGNVPIQSKVKMDHYDFALYYTFLDKLTLDIVHLDLGLNARAMKFEGTISQNSLGRTASKDLSLYIPMAYVGLQVKPIKAFSIEAEARAIAFGGNHYYDLIGRLKVMPVGPLFIAAGYRSETIKIDTNNVKTDIKFAGPFAEVGVTF